MPVVTPWQFDECLNRMAKSGSVKSQCAGLADNPSGRVACHYVIEFGCYHRTSWIWDREGNVITPAGELIAVPWTILKKDCVQGDTWSSRWKKTPEDVPWITADFSEWNPLDQISLLRLTASSAHVALGFPDPESYTTWLTGRAAGCGSLLGAPCHWQQAPVDDPYVLASRAYGCEPQLAGGGASAGRANSECLAKWVLDLSDEITGIGGVVLRCDTRYGGMSAWYILDNSYHGVGSFQANKRNRFLLYAKDEGMYLPNCLWVRPALILPDYYGGPGGIVGPCDGSNCEEGKTDFEECETGVNFAAPPIISFTVCGTEYITGVTDGLGWDGSSNCSVEESGQPATYSCLYFNYTVGISQQYFAGCAGTGTGSAPGGPDAVIVRWYIQTTVWYDSGWKYESWLQKEYYNPDFCPDPTRIGGTGYCVAKVSEGTGTQTQSCIGLHIDIGDIDVSGLGEMECDGMTERPVCEASEQCPPVIDPDNPPSTITLTVADLADNSTCDCVGTNGTFSLSLISNGATEIIWAYTISGNPCVGVWRVRYRKSLERWSAGWDNTGAAGGVVPYFQSANGSTTSPVSLPSFPTNNTVQCSCPTPATVSWT